MESEKDSESAAQLTALSNRVGESLQADVLFYNGEINSPNDTRVMTLCDGLTRRRPHLFLIPVTYGGSAHSAFRMARCFQRKYERVIVSVSGRCVSAGTLLAIGAHELVMSDFGELGPLDVQTPKTDELWEMTSGLTVLQALDSIRVQAFQSFEYNLLNLKLKSGGQITLKTAMQIAAQLTSGLLGKLYEQIDPQKLGEDSRSMQIAQEYGSRLQHFSNNLKEGALDNLIASYPSHSFIIDREEAESLFSSVRGPSSIENELLNFLGPLARDPQEEVTTAFLSGTDETAVEVNHAAGNEFATSDTADTKTADREAVTSLPPSEPERRSGPNLVTTGDSQKGR